MIVIKEPSIQTQTQRKASSRKGSVQSSITSTVKKPNKELTRNIPKMEEFEPRSEYSNIMSSYSEIMMHKKKNLKKCHKKEHSKSFILGQHMPSTLSTKSSVVWKEGSYIENYIKTVNRYLGNKNSNRFYFRRHTADCKKQKSEKPKKYKAVFKDNTNKENHCSNTSTNMVNTSNHSSNVQSVKTLEAVRERQSEQRTTIKKCSEFSSNESTPRIEEEEIIVNTLSGGYAEAIKKSFHDKNLR